MFVLCNLLEKDSEERKIKCEQENIFTQNDLEDNRKRMKEEISKVYSQHDYRHG